MTYDHWKTAEPRWMTEGEPPKETDEDKLHQCDCCGKMAVLSRCWAYGIETYACDECRRAP